MVVYDHLDPDNQVKVYDKGIDLRTREEERRIMVEYRTGDMYAPRLDRTEALAGVVTEFADAIATKRTPLTGAAAGIHVVSLLEAAEKSLRSEGTRVRL